MAALIAVAFLAVLFSLVILLTLLRLARLGQELEELRRRVDDIDRRAPAARSKGAGALPTSVAPAIPLVPTTVEPPEATASVASGSAREISGESQRDFAQAASVRESSPDALGVPEPLAGPTPAGEDFEERLGGRGLLYVGVLVLLLGISFFLKYAFDNAWINETARTVLGTLAGVGLVIGGLRFARTGLETFGHALVGMGFAALYLVVYAALNFYFLIGRGPAFVLMFAITLAAAFIADRQRSQPLAFIAVGGGFLTPALVGGGENAQLTLFSYVALLVLGTMLLSFRHEWPVLNALSYFATFLTVVAWAGRFYTDDQWFRTLLFLTLYCVAFLIIVRETVRRSASASARAMAGLLSTSVVFYHIAAVVLTAGHPPAIHIYLIAFTVVGLWLTADPHRPAVRLALLFAAFIPMFGTLTLPDGRSWLVPNIVTIISVAVLHVMGLVDRSTRQEARLASADLLLLHVAGLGLFALLYEALLPAFPNFRGALAALVALGAAAMWRTLRTRDEIAALNAAALAMVLIAIGIGVQFDGATVTIGWAAEGLAGLWLGLRAPHRGFLFGGVILWALAALRLFDAFAETPAAFTALFNARTFATIFVVVSGYVMAWRLGSHGGEEISRLRIAIHVIASAMTLRWLTAEIQSFWEVRADRPQAFLYEQTLLSLAWGLYGAALIAVGMWRKYAPLRYIGIVVIAAASLKVFFYDLWELGGIYRVVGFITFGILLVLVSYLYQRRRRRSHISPATPPPHVIQNAADANRSER